MTVKRDVTVPARKYDFIQIWRGIAVLLVVYYHFSNRVPQEYLGMDSDPFLVFYSGKLGVLVFFIISGYLIAKSLSHSQNLARFYAKRISRIWPLFILASLSIFLFLQFFEPPVVPSGPKKFFVEERDGLDLFGSLFFLEDLGFRWMDGVFWSILVELKFYFWIGLLAWFRPRSFARDFAILSIAMSAIEMIIGLSEMRFLGPIGSGLNGFFIAQYLPYFAIGVLLLTNKHRPLLSIVIILALAQALLKSAANPDFEAAGTAIFTLFLAACLALDAALLQSRLFLHIGDNSYGFYLFHQIIGLTIIKALSGYLSYQVAIFVALVATYVLAVSASWIAEWRFRQFFFDRLMTIFTLLKMEKLQLARSEK
ncbi:acyltransferase family protein [Parasphingorhabdus halotolerans]|uniref:Acyltransferase n=1 Tax=Parasphingorhabdus halotolerans TaxID=2725558 RepID=A0A6H2DNI5_9SPHN|nr:acyltransferase [Parasphingorhabdus halotolerans]QJB69697.1 acyltransferase [Parasphingorhabdus halotolerans]